MTDNEVKLLCKAVAESLRGYVDKGVIPSKPTSRQIVKIRSAAAFVKDGSLDQYGLFTYMNESEKVPNTLESFQKNGRSTNVLYYALLSEAYIKDPINLCGEMITNYCRDNGFGSVIIGGIFEEDAKRELFDAMSEADTYAAAGEYSQFLAANFGIEFSLHSLNPKESLKVITTWGDIILTTIKHLGDMYAKERAEKSS
jgi:hypothetical protein